MMFWVGLQPYCLAIIYRLIGLYIFLGLLALVGLFVLLVIVVGLSERHHLAGDIEATQEPYPYPATPYWQATRRDAMSLGLRHVGDFATKKHTTMVKGLQSMFVTQDNQVLVAIVDGSFAATKMKKTVLRSRFPLGTVIESSDNPGSVRDFSGVIDRQVLLNAGMAELLNFHLGRLRVAREQPVVFNAEKALAEYERMDLERGERWVLLGMARWANPERTTMRLTFRGAWGHVRGMFVGISDLEEQSHRTSIKRAGARPGDK